jgi:tetratricopeptide (TPR) repeat protein|uniref:Tetratricopeptide repeat protein n=1 Tax=Schlesneria paludicola TaxID=360056 RepID=A0A7C4QH68_9PLAN
MTPRDAQKTVKRLAAAEGYLELAMPTEALKVLEGLQTEGPFEAIAQLFRGEALHAIRRFEEAIPAFNRAAELFPAPFNQRALLGLSDCYRQQGQEELAKQAAAAATPPDAPPGTTLQLLIVPIFQIDQGSQRRRSAPPKG